MIHLNFPGALYADPLMTGAEAFHTLLMQDMRHFCRLPV